MARRSLKLAEVREQLKLKTEKTRLRIRQEEDRQRVREINAKLSAMAPTRPASSS